MKKSLKISNNEFLVLNSIALVIFEDTSIQVQMVHPEMVIDIVNKDYNSYFGHHSVPVNEFKRIERELREYLGIEEVASNKE